MCQKHERDLDDQAAIVRFGIIIDWYDRIVLSRVFLGFGNELFIPPSVAFVCYPNPHHRVFL